MVRLNLGLLVNTIRYTPDSLAAAVEVWNAAPRRVRMGEDKILGYGSMKHESAEERMAKLECVNLDNVVVTDVRLEITAEGVVATGIPTSPFVRAVSSAPWPTFAIRGKTLPEPNRNVLIKIIAIDLIGIFRHNQPPRDNSDTPTKFKGFKYVSR